MRDSMRDWVRAGVRKAGSALIVASSHAVSTAHALKYRALYPDSLILGRKVQLGARTKIRISGTGRIEIGSNTVIGDDCLLIAKNATLSVGKDAFVGDGCQIVARIGVRIGDDAMLAAGCVVRDGDHRFEDPETPIRLQAHTEHPIEIGNDVWLGSHVVVTAGSTVGNGAVVGANAVVKGRLEPYTISVANVARSVGQRKRLNDRSSSRNV